MRKEPTEKEVAKLKRLIRKLYNSGELTLKYTVNHFYYENGLVKEPIDYEYNILTSDIKSIRSNGRTQYADGRVVKNYVIILSDPYGYDHLRIRFTYDDYLYLIIQDARNNKLKKIGI